MLLKESRYGCDFATKIITERWLITSSSLKQLTFDQTRQNGYQTVPFIVYIHKLMFFFSFWSECSENSLGKVVILPLVRISHFT